MATSTTLLIGYYLERSIIKLLVPSKVRSDMIFDIWFLKRNIVNVLKQWFANQCILQYMSQTAIKILTTTYK